MFAMFEGRAFQQIVGIPMGINCFVSSTVPFLVQDILFTRFSKKKTKHLAAFVDRIFPITEDTARYGYTLTRTSRLTVGASLERSCTTKEVISILHLSRS